MKILIVTIIVTLVSLIVAFITTGAGHGLYDFARILYPYTMFFAHKIRTISEPLAWLGLLQFPIYGSLSAIANKHNKLRISLVGISAIHLLFVFLAFGNISNNFN